MPAVAAGIEMPEEMRALLKKGCKYGQGFYFSKALPAGQTVALLEVGVKPILMA
ncbi:MAG: hypothetical protein PHU07_03795 [Acidocella sp.]|nr:hypothetical protein [Acidocella sp.]